MFKKYNLLVHAVPGTVEKVAERIGMKNQNVNDLDIVKLKIVFRIF
jgi:hypothetical protein